MSSWIYINSRVLLKWQWSALQENVSVKWMMCKMTTFSHDFCFPTLFFLSSFIFFPHSIHPSSSHPYSPSFNTMLMQAGMATLCVCVHISVMGINLVCTKLRGLHTHSHTHLCVCLTDTADKQVWRHWVEGWKNVSGLQNKEDIMWIFVCQKHSQSYLKLLFYFDDAFVTFPKASLGSTLRHWLDLTSKFTPLGKSPHVCRDSTRHKKN